MSLLSRMPTAEEIACDEAIRTVALNASIAWFRNVGGEEAVDRVPRQVIIDTARRFEEYIRTGE